LCCFICELRAAAIFSIYVGYWYRGLAVYLLYFRLSVLFDCDCTIYSYIVGSINIEIWYDIGSYSILFNVVRCIVPEILSCIICTTLVGIIWRAFYMNICRLLIYYIPPTNSISFCSSLSQSIKYLQTKH